VTVAVAAGCAAALSAWFAGVAVREHRRTKTLARAGVSSDRGVGKGLEKGRVAAWCLGDRRARVALAGLGAGAGLLTGGPPLALCAAVAGAALPAVLARANDTKRVERMEGQLAEAAASIAAALRSGLSLQQSIRFASEEGSPPVSRALSQVIQQEEFGIPLEDALERWASGANSADVRLVASVLQLHHRVGGESPAILDRVARTVRLRRTAARELRSLTAQARLSGAVLGLLPIGFFAFMSIVSRHDVQAAYRTSAGLASIVLGLALDAGAFLWIRTLLRVEV
jgi:tight adherence protein B